MTKLTLSVEEDVVQQAKRIAEANKTSVSAMFTNFVRSMAGGAGRNIRPGRIARQAAGLFRLPPGKDDKELVAEALVEKYLNTK